MLPYAAQPGHAHAAAGLGATISLAAACLLCVCTLLTLQTTLYCFRDTVSHVADNPEDREERCKTIGHVSRKPGGLRFLWEERVVVLAPMATLLFSSEALYTWQVVLSSRIPVAPYGDVTFWRTYQVTLLIMCANTFAFFGRSIGLRATPSHGIDLRVLGWWSLTPLAAIVTFGYWKAWVPPSHAFPLVLYAVSALVNGFTLVLLNKSSQAGLLSARTGRHSVTWNPCPIAAQLVWFSIQLGAFCPAFLANWIL